MGAVRAIPNYNVMGVARRRLEASVRYLPPIWGRTASASTASRPDRCARWLIGDRRRALMFRWNRMNAPMKRNIELEHVGNAGLYLLSDPSGGVTGEIHYVDSGYNIVGMPSTADLKSMGLPDENGEAKSARGRMSYILYGDPDPGSVHPEALLAEIGARRTARHLARQVRAD